MDPVLLRANMGNEPRKSQPFRLVFFVIGLSIGVMISVYCKSYVFKLQTNLYLFSSSPPTTLFSLPLPSPSSSSPPTTLFSLPLPSPSSSSPPLPLPDSGVVTSNIEVQAPLVHDMDDDLKLFWKASLVPRIRDFPYNRVPKVAFMFLTKGPIPLAPLWEMFFKDHQELYTIYVHPHPSYVDSWPENSVFHGRRIPSKEVQWGQPSMIDAERRLLASALLDFSNERFVLVSETCIPLFNFTTVYNYLMNANKSFVASYDDPRKVGRGRYNPLMSPSITVSDWRKGSQWFEVNRNLAVEIVSDNKYYPIFKEHCSPPCYMDEHYIPTLVNIISPGENSNQTITWVDWSQSGPHPGKFNRDAVSAEFLNQIRFGTNGTCDGDANTSASLCFLFARKFLPGTLQPLLQIAPMSLGSISS